jgi:hypothetical protein
MAWEWSHTTEAYDNARENVDNLPRKTLLVILREWAYHDREQRGKDGSFRLPNGIRSMPRSELAEMVNTRMEEQRTCDSGGFNAWCCPEGCHTVSFDLPKERTN